MRYLLDTNAISEPSKLAPNQAYMTWVKKSDESQLATSCLVIGELHKGLALVLNGKQKERLKSFVKDVTSAMDDKILPLLTEDCVIWAKLFAEAQRVGKKPSVIDSLIAAQAISHDLTLVTRNVKDFQQFPNLKILNPWATQKQ